MTDLWDYLRMLYATLGTPHCPRCEQPVPRVRSNKCSSICCACPKARKSKCARLSSKSLARIGNTCSNRCACKATDACAWMESHSDLGSHFELSEEEHPWVEAIIDRFVVGPGIDRQVLASLEHGLKVGDGFLSFHPEGLSQAR